MKLKQYIAVSPKGVSLALAKELDVSPSYLSQMVNGKAPISERRAVRIEKLTKKKVLREDMFEDWEEIWPELRARQKRRTPQDCSA
jgi:DNA-binding transcriptional regulator YdaS (Cro superfamily)